MRLRGRSTGPSRQACALSERGDSREKLRRDQTPRADARPGTAAGHRGPATASQTQPTSLLVCE